MSDINSGFADTPANNRDFGAGISESSFGQDPGADGSRASGGAGSFRGQTANLRDQAAEKLRSFADEGKQQVTNSLDGLVEAARELANKVGDKGGPLGGYAHSAADTLEGWAGVVKDKSVEDLIDDARDFARQSPGVAVGIAVAAGFALSRFLKASGGGRYAS